MIRNYFVLTLLYILLVFVPLPTLSQPVKYEIVRGMTFSVPFLPDPQSYNKNGNEILVEMAKEVLKDPWKVKIVIQYHLQLCIAVSSSGKKIFILNTVNPEATGDIYYRLFNISDVLFPSRLNYRIRIGNKADSSMFQEKEFTNRTFGTSDTLSTGEDWPSFDPDSDTLTITSVELFYDEDARNEFYTRLDQINDYYACRSLLDTLNQLAQQVDLKDGSQLPINYIRIREIDHAIKLMGTRKFPETILLQDFDPKNWNEIFTATDKYSRSLTFTFKDELMNSGVIAWHGNLDSLSDYFTTRVLVYIRLSQKMSEINGSIYADWLNNYFQFSINENERSLINLMARKMFPDANQDTVLAYVSSNIYHAYQRLAKKLIDQNQFAHAFSLMEHASLFAANNAYFPKEMKENEIISEASMGVYNSYIGIAKTCLMNQKFNMADNYLAKAAEYRNNHPGFTFSDSLYNSVFSELFFQRNTECDELLSEKRYAEALVCYIYLEHSYDSLQLTAIRAELEQKKSDARYHLFLDVAQRTTKALSSNLPDTALFYFEKVKELECELMDIPEAGKKKDSLDPLIARINHDNLLQAGSRAVSQRLFSNAIRAFSQAKVIGEEYNFSTDLTFDSLYRLAVKQNLLINISVHQRLIWSNQFDSAKAYLDKVRQTVSSFNLSDDTDIQTATMRFLTKIEEQKCRNLNDTIQILLIRSDRSRALKNYLKSVSILRQVLVVTESSQECHSPAGAIRDSIAKYDNAALFQKQLEEANRNLVSGQYQKTVSLLAEAETFHLKHNLDRFGLPPVTLYEYTFSRGNPYLTEKAIAYFYGKSDLQEAMRYFHLLRLQGYTERNVIDTQDQIGRRMANIDLRKNSKADPISLVDAYTAKDPWFNTFRSSYLDEWNKLIKAMQPIR